MAPSLIFLRKNKDRLLLLTQRNVSLVNQTTELHTQCNPKCPWICVSLQVCGRSESCQMDTHWKGRGEPRSSVVRGQPELGRAGQGRIWASGKGGERMSGVRAPGDSVLGMRMPDVANKNTGRSIKFEFQANNRQFFLVKVCPMKYLGYTYTKVFFKF